MKKNTIAVLVAAAACAAMAGEVKWRPLGEPGVGGAMTCVAVSPHDKNHVIVCGDMLGVGVSFNGGARWRPGLGFSTCEMATATFHPTRTNEVWTGSCSGPYKSVDRGLTWERKRDGMPEPGRWRYTAMVEKVLFDPSDPSRMLAFGGSSRRWGKPCETFGTVWASSDGGDNWTRLGVIENGGGWTTNAVKGANIVEAFWGAAPSKPGAPRQVHLVADGAGWFSSIDGGATWRRRKTPGVEGRVAHVTAHPSDDRVFWLATEVGEKGENGRLEPGGLYKSVDGGRSFAPCDAGISKRRGERKMLTTHFSAVAVSAADPSRLYMSDASWAGAAVWKSDDGGATWRKVVWKWKIPMAGFAGYSGPLCTAPGDADVAFAWNSDTIIKTSDGGATWEDFSSFRPDPEKEPNVWRGRGWTGWCALNIAFDPYNKGRCAVQAMDACHAWVSGDGLRTWRYGAGSVTPWDGGQSAAFASDGTLYVSTGQRDRNAGILVSRDCGATWKTAVGAAAGLPEKDGGSYGCIFADRADPRKAFVLKGEKIYETADGGETWAGRDLGIKAGFAAEDPTKPGRYYVKTDDGVFATEDWRDFRGIGLEGKAEGKIACDAKGRVLACRGRVGSNFGLWRYDPARPDAGWTRLHEERLAFSVAVDPKDPKRIMFGGNDMPYHDGATGGGVWLSDDDGATWKKADEGLPVKRIFCCAFDPFDTSTILVGTSGCGFFKAKW